MKSLFKKLLPCSFVMIALFVFLLSLPVNANAASESDLEFTLNDDGISYSVTACSQSASGDITIPSTYYGKPVTSIGDDAFSGCTGLTSITIPNSVTTIDNYAFSSCTSLTSVTIGNSVTTIGDCAFEDCTGLTSITIPDSVTTIGSWAFSGCTSLTSIIIPDSVTTIGDSAFEYCTGLTSVTIGNSVTTIGSWAFSDCTGLTSVTIGNSVTTIGSWAFDACTGLTSVTIGNSVTTIGDGAFSGCTDLTNIYVKDLSAWCKITFDSSDANPMYYADNMILVDDSGNSVTEIVLDNSVTEIPDYAFINCKQLISITIPDSVTSIGKEAFEGCTGLTNVTIGNSVITIGNWAFSRCTSLTSVTISNSVTTIGDCAFYRCTSLKDVYFGGTETQWHQITIGEDNECLTNANIHFANSLIANGTCGENLTWALDNAGTLTISGTGTMENYSSSSSAPWYDQSSRIEQAVIENGVTTIGKYAFYNCTSLTSITIPDSVTSIGWYAFSGCTSLTSITVPNGVTAIGDGAFEDCTSLTSITIPDGVTTIMGGTFYDCTNLTSVTLPDSVTTIDVWAFAGCNALTTITIPDSVTTIGWCAFYNCTSLTSITIPDSVTTIEDQAFFNCSGLTSITIPDGVTGIREYTFKYCTSLTSVTIPESVTYIGYDAFSNCGIRNIYYIGTKSQWDEIDFEEDNTAVTNAPYIHYNCASADGHWEESKVNATCSQKGYTAHTCKCGYSYESNYVVALGHSYTKKVVKPTEKAQGYTLYTCACGDSYKDDYVLLAPTVAIKLDATSGKPVLTWNTIGGASSYYVYRSASKSGTYTKVATVKKATTWTDTSADVGTKYYYKLKAVASGCSSGYSNLVAQTAKCAVPSITVTVKSGRPYISWGKVSGAEKYAVYYSTSKTGTYKKLVTTKKTYYAHSDAPTGSQYFYKVKSVAATTTYDSGYSSIKSCNIPCAKLAVTAKNDAASGYPVLTWKAVTGAKKYEVYRSQAGKNAYEKIATTTAKTYTDKKATVNKKYDYQVRALGSTSALNSAMSTKDTIICKVAAPVISVKINGSGKPVVSWKAVKGAKSYVVYRSTSATKSYKKYTGGKLDVKKCTFTDTAVTAGKTYYYKVVAVGTGNESAYSGYKKATGTCATPSVTVKLSSNKPVLKWGKVSGAKKYEIQYSTNGKTFKTLTTTTSTSYTHKAKKGTYYYKVKALGSKSSYDSALSAATKAVKVK